MSVTSETSDSVCDCAPTPAEIRAALDHMLFSNVFSRSPQLGAFLRFVTEAVLHGKGDRIKAYAIGVEVLRRDPTFDPQIDPIVRVEATRLRRAMERYYAGPGQDDSIVIDLPRGSYAPAFRRRELATPVELGRHGRAVAGTVASDAHACAAGGGHDRRHRRGRVRLLCRSPGGDYGFNRRFCARRRNAAQCSAARRQRHAGRTDRADSRHRYAVARFRRPRTAARQDRRCVRAFRHDQRGVQPGAGECRYADAHAAYGLHAVRFAGICRKRRQCLVYAHQRGRGQGRMVADL